MESTRLPEGEGRLRCRYEICIEGNDVVSVGRCRLQEEIRGVGKGATGWSSNVRGVF